MKRAVFIAILLSQSSLAALAQVGGSGVSAPFGGGGSVNFCPVRVMNEGDSTTTTTSDCMLAVNKITGSATGVTLNVSPFAGQVLVIKDAKGDASTFNITITPSMGNIDASATYVINTDYGSVRLVYTGTQWVTSQ